MITLRGLTIGFGDRTLLSEADATFGKGSVSALIGRNGTGKSTLLRAMADLNRDYRGLIEIGGKDMRRLSRNDAARRVAYVSTERIRVTNLRCEDVVATGRAPYTGWTGRLQDVDREAVAKALATVGMTDYARRTMDTMSDGECQRVMIARALAQSTPAILLDEPTSFLDMPSRYSLARLLGRLAHDEGKCIIFSTHELDIALGMTDTVALIDPPHLRVMPTSEMKTSGLIERLFGIDG